ncbi:HNH endonuclease (plasmid) [Chondrocystis sp. NIES-4102]|nr:HNH endonuclease [Chondrocystis sp. NIES-4102]
MPRSKISEIIQAQIRQRANYLCEYCHASEQWQYVRFTIDHVIPLAQGGVDSLENLALACFHCNRRKSNNLIGIDPQLEIKTPLFNPRCDRWYDHFIWSVDQLYIVGLTATGRATVEALAMNRERVIHIRAADRDVGRHPPKDDPIQQGS